ncbi:MFS transporter [Sediminibacillus albus]|uniref:Predicted arabinose efflux permease, MFS family n=1 Tax=Sediminibacillus albus TaxID=407036 RepID=A0A1G8X048_9BACI|nr:MFS transporter [Sediminibacillus albus]SDJ83235.1 Predicted arabinose efflux permease, MFS family [Sediminibacillus albus]
MLLSAKRKIIGIAVITAVSVLGDAMLLVVLPLYWPEFGLAAVWQVGLLLSINRFIRLPINPLIGLFYKHVQLRTGVFIAVGLAVLTTMSYGVFNQFWILFFLRALWGISWSLLRLGGFLTVIEETDEQNRGQYVGLYNGLWGIGGLFGMLVGGILVDQTSIFFVTTLFAGMGLLTLPFVWLLVPVKKGGGQPKALKETASLAWFFPYQRMVLLTGMAVGLIVFGIFASTLSQLIARSYAGGWIALELSIGAATLAGIIQAVRWSWDPFVAPMVGKVIDGSNLKHHLLLIPAFSGAVLLILLAHTSSIVSLIILLLMFQLTSTAFVTTADTLAARAAVQSDQLKMMTAYTVVIDIGAALGPLMAFFLLQRSSITILYDLAGCSLLLLGVAWIIFNRRNSNP